MDKVLAKLISKTPSRWKENAQFRAENKWLRHSSAIARRIIAAMEDNPVITQESLAENLGASKQRISAILKGRENLTLETIYKLEQALSITLIEFPQYKYSQP